MIVDWKKFSECVPTGSKVRVKGDIYFTSVNFKDEQGILIRYDSDVDLPAKFDGWASMTPYVPRLVPVHLGAVAIQFFHERTMRLIDPYDLEYAINNNWKTLREVMA